jgi:tetratricopeptide (TPR) repeat protein
MIQPGILALAGVALALGACGPDRATTEAAAQLSYRRSYEAINAGDWLKAQQYLIQARQAFPNDPYIVLNLGVVAQRLGHFDEARGYYDQVVAMAPDVIPEQVTDPNAAGKTLADIARDDIETLPK